MANTYTQVLVQLVFAVKGRQSMIADKNRVAVEKYICGIISATKSKPLAIYCNPDHCHVLIGLNPAVAISDIARLIKANSAKWINENRLTKFRFEWQSGFGAFTYGRSQLDMIVGYIRNQPKHHRKKTFKEEYLEFLDKFEVDYKEAYVFDFIE